MPLPPPADQSRRLISPVSCAAARQEGVKVLSGSMTAAQLAIRLGRVDRTPDLRAHLTSDPSGRLFLMLWGGMAVTGSARLAGAPAATQMAMVTVLLVVCSLNQPYRAALAVAVVAWLLVTGFVVNQYGDLHLSGKGDLYRLSFLVLLALAAARWRRQTRTMTDHDGQPLREGEAWNR